MIVPGQSTHYQESRGGDIRTRENTPPSGGQALPGRFGRIFDLPAFDPSPDLLKDLACRMTVDPVVAGDEENDSEIPSGYTFLGQFITHDLTFDTTSLQDQANDQQAPSSYRTPRLDLDSVYCQSPTLKDPPKRNGAKMAIDSRSDQDETIEDLPRYPQGSTDPERPAGRAIIGDPRNDETVVLCQLHLAFLKLHNRFVDEFWADGERDEGRLYELAQEQCRWHFQWVVVNDYLPKIVDEKVLKQILLSKPGDPPNVRLKFYKPVDPAKPMIPLEFAVAAFRFGHSMIRPVYRVGRGGFAVRLFPRSNGDDHLGGLRPITSSHVVVWSRFFHDLPPASVELKNHAKKIDARMPESLGRIPVQFSPGSADTSPETFSLALRDLQKGVDRKLPSGQRVAGAIKTKFDETEVLSNAKLCEESPHLSLNNPGWKDQAPLWFYILQEARQQAGGEHLGQVGSRIVAEVILGLLKYDPTSYFNAKPDFLPTTVGGGRPIDFKMGSLLQLAEVAPLQS